MCDTCCGDGYIQMSCCGDDMKGRWEDNDLCPSCNEHCGEPDHEECDECDGTGVEMKMPKRRTVHERVLTVYREQLKTFRKLGIGGVTQYNTKVTEDLIDITKKRMRELLFNKFN